MWWFLKKIVSNLCFYYIVYGWRDIAKYANGKRPGHSISSNIQYKQKGHNDSLWTLFKADLGSSFKDVILVFDKDVFKIFVTIINSCSIRFEAGFCTSCILRLMMSIWTFWNWNKSKYSRDQIIWAEFDFGLSKSIYKTPSILWVDVTWMLASK